MAELDSEDSSDGTLVIDEPNQDNETIEISDDSDIDIIDAINNIEDTSSTSNHPSSSSNSHLTCQLCYRFFSTNNELLNHIRKFKGRIGGCNTETNLNTTSTNRGKKSKDCTPELKVDQVCEKKKGNSPKIYSKLPVPESVPTIPPLIPIILKPTSPINYNCTKEICADNDLPSVRQMLVEETDPAYPCTVCGQIFRHYIGLVCHLNSEHYNLSSEKVILKTRKSSTKSNEKKQNFRKSVIMKHKSVITEHKSVENNEPVSNTVDLTLMSDSKKDSLLNRMKSYLQSHNKNLVVCILCNMKFQSTKKALSHIEDKHIMNKIKCGYCNMKFVYELKLRSHMAKRHNIIGVYKCDKCSKIMNKDECESHLEKCKGNPVTIKREEVNVL